MRRQWTVALLFAVLAPAVRAQAPEERAELGRLRDSLSSVVDTTALLRLESQCIDIARNRRDEPMLHLRLGLMALRLDELRDGPHRDHAIAEFEWAAELRPDWPWPWYGIGLAEVRGRDVAGGFGGGLWTMLGLDRDRLAGVAFARAVNADPTFVHALTEFARVALEQRIDAPLFPALEALRVATSTPIGWESDLLLSLGRLERLAGSADSAKQAFRRAILLAPAPAIAWLELSRTLPLGLTAEIEPSEKLRRSTELAYFEGARVASMSVLAMYRRDVEPIASADELAEFDLLSLGQHAAWLRRFWAARDALALRAGGSRLTEHFRRWNTAQREFRLPPFRRGYRYGTEIYRSNDEELDDRGIVWIRHGEPTLRIVWPKGRGAFRPNPRDRASGNESWRYDRPDGRFTLHFTAIDDPNDYRLVATPTDLDVALDQLERRSGDLPELARLIRAGPVTRVWVAEEIRREGQLAIALATQTDSWERHYDKVLTGRATWHVVGVRNEQPMAHLVYAVDAEALRSVQGADVTSRVPVRVRASFLDVDGAPVATLDTVQMLHVPTGPGQLAASRAEVVVPPGAMTVRYGVELGPSYGVVYPMVKLTAPPPDARQLEVSGVLLGRSNRSLRWQASPADTAWLDASGAYAPIDTIVVYAEAYGIPRDSVATVRLEVTRRRSGIARFLGGRREAIALTERIPGPGGVLRINRALALGGLNPGEYELELVIEAGGRTVQRSRGFFVR